MTAVVGVLNKQAVAIAADSAVTIGNGIGTKIFNGANKIFTLSKFRPVAIMIYNNATFLGTPWETIIKVYRNQIGEKSFSKLEEYQSDFLLFLRKSDFFDHENYRMESMKVFILTLFEKKILKEVYDRTEKSSSNLREKILSLTAQLVGQYIKKLSDRNIVCQDFEGYTFQDFLQVYHVELKNLISSIFEKNNLDAQDVLIDEIIKLSFLAITSKNVFLIHSGLVFTGFGESEIFPQLVSLKISFPVGDRLKYVIEDDKAVKISPKNQSAIVPFAQQDVIDTILSGIDPTYETTMIKNFQLSLNKYNELLFETLQKTDPNLAAQIKSIDNSEIINELRKTNNSFKQLKYIDPLMAAVATLSKGDIAEMAESLIYLTYLKRRITFAQESVGGPVDVAIISKGDGFIWIKRKHYFDPKFNPTFFKNYLNL